MHALRPRRTRRPRSAATLLAAAVGLAAIGTAAPAAAATAPTISAPEWGTTAAPITISGTAAPGATVTLIEAAYIFRSDMYPAPDYDTGGTVTAVADSSGHYAMQRLLDSGFVFAVEAGGLRSQTIAVSVLALLAITVSSGSTGTVTVGVAVDPKQPGLPVQVQRAGSGGAWSTVAAGVLDAGGAYSTVLTGQGTATQQYRAYTAGDSENAVLPNYSATVDSTGAEVTPAPTTPGTTPTTPNPPTPTPTPAPVAPKPGDIQFSKIVYNSPGADTGSNASLNGEYVRLTNKTKRAIDLRDWTIRDAAGHVYRFSTSHPLGAGKTLYVHTGRGTDGRPDTAHRYWGSTGYIWNNGGDTAILRTGSNRTIDSCAWGNGTGTTFC